jgi:hypothetical protein
MGWANVEILSPVAATVIYLPRYRPRPIQGQVAPAQDDQSGLHKC